MKPARLLSFIHLPRSSFMPTTMITCTLLATLIVSTHAWFAKAKISDQAGLAVVAQSQPVLGRSAQVIPNATPLARLPVLVTNLTRFGFEPSQRTAPTGQCLLAVANRSGLEEVDLQLFRKTAERLVAEKYRRGKRHWEKLLNLSPGEYELVVVGHPEWVLKITIKAHGYQ